jgi:hypothetical protein
VSDTRLPPVAATVLVAAVDGLAARLRGKLDASTARVAGWDIRVDGDNYVITVDPDTTVCLIADAGVVRTADAATCTCLLAPNCLHRVSVLAAAPVEDPDSVDNPAPTDDPGSASPPQTAGPTADTAAASESETAVLTDAQRAAIATLWEAAVAVLESGVTGSGIVARTGLLRAAHEAQATGVHRAAGLARSVATLLQAARDNAPQYRLADLTDAVRDLLAVLHRLSGASVPPDLLGSGRRRYDVQGSLRLYGLCTIAVLADSGYAGVVTYVIDTAGTIWAIADIAPGDAERAATAGNATVALGDSALQHRQLTRAGLVVSGATAADTRHLGAGKSVRAVTAPGATWHDGPATRLWAEPAADQLRRAFTALAQPVTERRAGDDLVFLTVRIEQHPSGPVHAVTTDGSRIRLLVASDHPALAYRDNLRLLGRSPGLDLLLIGRPVRATTAGVEALAVAPAAGAIGWTLPPALSGHIDLAYDRLHASHLPSVGDEPGSVTAEAGGGAAGPALELLRRNVDRVAAGGRGVMALPPSTRYPSDALRLRRARLETGAQLLDALTAAAVNRQRDAFGRLAGDDSSAFARAWLAAAVYADAADRSLAEASWTVA